MLGTVETRYTLVFCNLTFVTTRWSTVAFPQSCTVLDGLPLRVIFVERRLPWSLT
jgi:hypothetical protein